MCIFESLCAFTLTVYYTSQKDEECASLAFVVTRKTSFELSEYNYIPSEICCHYSVVKWDNTYETKFQIKKCNFLATSIRSIKVTHAPIIKSSLFIHAPPREKEQNGFERVDKILFRTNFQERWGRQIVDSQSLSLLLNLSAFKLLTQNVNLWTLWLFLTGLMNF